MSEEVISEGISLADRMTRLNSAEPVFTDGGHAEGTDGYNAQSLHSTLLMQLGQLKKQNYKLK